MKISSEITGNGIRIDAGAGKKFNISYPGKVWSGLKKDTQVSLRDNITYLRLAGYGALQKDPVVFSTNRPALKQYFDRCALMDAPHFAFQDRISSTKLIEAFKKAKYAFSSEKRVMPDEKAELDDGSVLAMSLGKDSLLSYGLMKELGIKTRLIFFEDFWDMELFHKKKLMAKFENEFNEKIHTGRDEIDNIHLEKSVNKTGSEGVEGSNAMNGYLLMTLPFNYHFKLNTVVFGNEQNFNDYFIDDDGNKCYPSCDQSSEWMLEQAKMLTLLSGKKMGVHSYVEPIYNLAEVRVLFKRYPKIAKYQVSCTHTMKENKENRWCFGCPMCAKAFLYMSANGVDTKTVDFKVNFFSKEFRSMYPLFNKNPTRPYEKPKAVRDEQLLAFYLAERNGSKGALIDEFRKEFKAEAKEREEELRKKFLGIHEAKTLPGKLKSQLRSIYKEELDF